ncbi:hypothetical protein ACWCRD_30650 [Streptomyces sp. NPDC002092]
MIAEVLNRRTELDVKLAEVHCPDEVLDQPFYGLDFGLPTVKPRETVERCVETGRRGEPLPGPPSTV